MKILLILALFAFGSHQTSFIRGKLTPPDKALRVLAVVNSDTMTASITDGFFEFKNVRAGIYTIIVEAQAPYLLVQRKGVIVKDGLTTELGEIRLEPK